MKPLCRAGWEKRYANSSGASETTTTKVIPQRDGLFLMAPLRLQPCTLNQDFHLADNELHDAGTRQPKPY